MPGFLAHRRLRQDYTVKASLGHMQVQGQPRSHSEALSQNKIGVYLLLQCSVSNPGLCHARQVLCCLAVPSIPEGILFRSLSSMCEIMVRDRLLGLYLFSL